MFEDMDELDEHSVETIMIEMMKKENVEPKTEIHRPGNLAKLNTLAVWLRIEKMNKPAKLIEGFINTYLLYMISYKRQGRKEVFAALTESMKRERSLTDKLTKTSE